MDVFNYLVPSYFEIGELEIVILQDPYGKILTIKINSYE
tara:strand:- start:1040 stop:1156 length:117 start_codon:yes stop_codon:yes gene_type:complete